MAMCEKCWTEARKRHAAGEGESVTEIYNTLVDEDWCWPAAPSKGREERDLMDEVLGHMEICHTPGCYIDGRCSHCRKSARSIIQAVRTHSFERP